MKVKHPSQEIIDQANHIFLAKKTSGSCLFLCLEGLFDSNRPTYQNIPKLRKNVFDPHYIVSAEILCCVVI